jgi:hypothetical protein
MATVWNSEYRGGVPVPLGNSLAPNALGSAAIKYAPLPSGVYFKLSVNGTDWSADAPDDGGAQLSFMVKVGELDSDSKEPLSLVKRGGVLEITNGAGTKKWRSLNTGRTWELVTED